MIDTNGVIHEVYGRKVLNNLRAGTAYHLYLPGPHADVWNEEGVISSGGEMILCEALIDAMTFWVHGLRNVTASYGAGGFTDDHLAAFQRHGVKRVLIAYDRDDAGNQAAAALAEKLTAQGIGCYRILFPKGMDANEYALKMAPPDKALALLIRKAEWMDEGRGPAPTSAPLDAVADVSALADLPGRQNAHAARPHEIPVAEAFTPNRLTQLVRDHVNAAGIGKSGACQRT
ncbi:toprim domain-containing protein [Janthinobacterium sp. FT14W]|uniref:toprim domain-containing protein n=1 Tax=Janthinobacterium sp. FT14W TaxID=2654253 RepID=UPI001D00615B|nr:toprim domain-containing protein [Janthinobacterium sp. FT14W]